MSNPTPYGAQHVTGDEEFEYDENLYATEKAIDALSEQSRKTEHSIARCSASNKSSPITDAEPESVTENLLDRDIEYFHMPSPVRDFHQSRYSDYLHVVLIILILLVLAYYLSK